MIHVNDRSYPYRSGMSLLELLVMDSVNIHDSVLITRNGLLVRKDSYGETALSDEDEILVIRVSTGG